MSAKTKAEITESSKLVLRIASGIFIAYLAIGVWEIVKEQGWIYHDQLITVYSRNWASGEYKDCTSPNPKDPNQSYLNCPPWASGEAKEFKVRFWGLTQTDDKPSTYVHNWKCRKNSSSWLSGDNDPTITCDIQKSQ